MIHELIDPKKKGNKTAASKNTKAFQDTRNTFEDCAFEVSDSENKEAESSSTTFIPPWLRNSLGLNQKNNLSNATTNSDSKSAKLSARAKETNQNEFESLKTNLEQDCNKKVTEHFKVSPQACPENATFTEGADNVDTADNTSERGISVYWNVRRKESEAESIFTNAEEKSLKIDESKMTNTDMLNSVEIGRLKEEDKKRLKLIKQKAKLKKRLWGDPKQSDLDKTDVDFLLEMKAREVLDSYMKRDVHSVSSEIRNLEAKLLGTTGKSQDVNNTKLGQQELRLLQEIRNQVGNSEEFERVFEHVKDINLRDIIKNSEFLSKNPIEKKKVEEKEEKTTREIKKFNEDKQALEDKESVLSTDDENDIKRFSEFLSKNKNLDEKRKCLEEVRNYFERKRKTRLTKRRLLEEGKTKSPEPERKEDQAKEKQKYREVYRGMKSKFALCDEEVVEKAVDETLQKFIDMYHIHVSPTVMGNMKKNILQAMTTDSLDGSRLKLNALESISTAKTINMELLNLMSKEPEKLDTFPETEIPEVNKDLMFHKEAKKKNFKSVVESSGEHTTKPAKEQESVDDEMLKRLKKEFDSFLYSVLNRVDVTNLKLQSIILEKEEQTGSSKNVQFVYNFTKKSLETDRRESWQSYKGVLECQNRKDTEVQTVHEVDILKRNVKVQAFELKNICEQSIQTEEKVYHPQSTQTTDDGITVREIRNLSSCDVYPGLYRMVKSKEAGKFYLYPEQTEDSKQEVCEKSNSSVVMDKKFNKKRDLLNILSKERTKERRIFFREKEKAKLKRSKKALYALAHLKGASVKRGLKGEQKQLVSSGNSISCLYFRNFDNKKSGSFSSKKEITLTEENIAGRLETGRVMGVGEIKKISKEDHLGCFWFWNGKKIAPGCDLKTHVEDLLKEKLKEITNFDNQQSELVINSLSLMKDETEQSKDSQRDLDVDNTKTAFSFENDPNTGIENSIMNIENESLEERNKTEEKKNENDEEIVDALIPESQKKSVRSVATQNSQQTFVPFNLSTLKIESKMGNAVKKKIRKRSVVLKPSPAKTGSFKKAEDIIKAIEDLKRIKTELENSKKDISMDSESALDGSTYTSGSKIEEEDPLTEVLGLKEGPEIEDMSNMDFKNKLKQLMGFVDREIQTTEALDLDDGISTESQPVAYHKHLELIERVLSRVNQKERESLWNDVRDFIKTKIGTDINDEGAREVCIEIEQDMPKNEQGKLKHAVLAKGFYTKNEGDVEVEIDLTLDDLERILRQRQKKIRRRTLYRSSRSKKYLSSSSIQSDFTKDDLRRYHKYLHRFALRGGFVQEKELKAFLEK